MSRSRKILEEIGSWGYYRANQDHADEHNSLTRHGFEKCKNCCSDENIPHYKNYISSNEIKIDRANRNYIVIHPSGTTKKFNSLVDTINHIKN